MVYFAVDLEKKFRGSLPWETWTSEELLQNPRHRRKGRGSVRPERGSEREAQIAVVRRSQGRFESVERGHGETRGVGPHPSGYLTPFWRLQILLIIPSRETARNAQNLPQIHVRPSPLRAPALGLSGEVWGTSASIRETLRSAHNKRGPPKRVRLRPENWRGKYFGRIRKVRDDDSTGEVQHPLAPDAPGLPRVPDSLRLLRSLRDFPGGRRLHPQSDGCRSSR